MWPALIVGAVAFGFALVWLGFIPPPHAAILIRIRAGRAQVTKGRLRSDLLASVSHVLEDVRVGRGFIAITSQNRVSFSANIPAGIHQRLRNILMNRW
jgi:uncharacterized protein DUF3634